MISVGAFPFVAAGLMTAFGGAVQWLAHQDEAWVRAESVYVARVLTAPLFFGAAVFLFIGAIG